MFKSLLLALALFVPWAPPPCLRAAERHTASSAAHADPAAAAVRIPSHGASGTVIGSTKGKSWILGCAHMYLDSFGRLDAEALQRPLKMDGPHQPHAAPRPAAARLLACDAHLDLSLIELDNGPFHFLPVAPPGHPPSKNLLSIGYDEMCWPMTIKPVQLLLTQGNTTYTREKPWHGRSGGGLIDVDHGVLIGVVQGYETAPGGRGLYVSHQAVLTFLGKHWPKEAPKHAPAPQSPVPYSLRPSCPPGGV